MAFPHHCDCQEPVERGSALDLVTRGVARQLARFCSTHGCSQSEAMAELERLSAAPLGARNSTTIAARVTTLQAERFRAHAKTLGVAPGALLRMLAANAAARDESALAELKSVLGLAPDATAAQILDAVGALLDAMGDPEADNAAPLGEAPEPPPPDVSKLSRAEAIAEICAKRASDRAARRAPYRQHTKRK